MSAEELDLDSHDIVVVLTAFIDGVVTAAAAVELRLGARSATRSAGAAGGGVRRVPLGPIGPRDIALDRSLLRARQVSSIVLRCAYKACPWRGIRAVERLHE